MTDPQLPAGHQSSRLTRRLFLRATAGGTAGLAAWSLLSARTPAEARGSRRWSWASREDRPVRHRLAVRPGMAGSDQPGFDDSALATVTLPHTVAPLSWQDWDPSTWERVWVYRKHFDAPAGVTGMRVFLDFSAAMTHSTVTLNGTQVADHLGGYLPFSAEITGHLQPQGNVLAVTLDSTFNLDVPPDRPAPTSARLSTSGSPAGSTATSACGPCRRSSWPTCSPSRLTCWTPARRQVAVQATVDAAVVPAGSVEASPWT